MKLSKNLKLFLGLASLWPLIYLFVFFGFILTVVVAGMNEVDLEKGFPVAFGAIFVLHLLTILEIFALLTFYIYHLFTSGSVKEEYKALWAVVLFFGNMIAMPVYWYLYLWKEEAPKRRPAKKKRQKRG